MALSLSVSVWSAFFVELSPEEMVDVFAAAGYSATEFSTEHGAAMLARARSLPGGPEAAGRALRAYAADRGIVFPQGHLLLTVDLCAPDAVETLLPWLDLFLSLGITAAVLHAGGGRALDDAERFSRRAEALRRLTGHLRGTDMSICLENLCSPLDPRTAAELNALIDAVGGANLGICLDTGHLHLAAAAGAGDPTQGAFIRAAGSRLKALHIADNDTSGDQHLLPFGCGTVDWQDVMRGLREVGYSGLFNFEVPGERRAPLSVRREKLRYARALSDILLSDEFVL